MSHHCLGKANCKSRQVWVASSAGDESAERVFSFYAPAFDFVKIACKNNIPTYKRRERIGIDRSLRRSAGIVNRQKNKRVIFAHARRKSHRKRIHHLHQRPVAVRPPNDTNPLRIKRGKRLPHGGKLLGIMRVIIIDALADFLETPLNTLK